LEFEIYEFGILIMDIVSTQQKQKMHPHKFTMWVAIGSLVMMFAGFSTAVILISSLTLQMALRSFKQREMSKYRLLIGITFILGAAFVVFQWFGFQELWAQQITFKGAGAGQFLYVIFGLHAIHVIGGIVTLLIMFIKTFVGKTKLYSSVPIEVAAVYWHFVDLLWIYLLLFFLIIGG